MIEVIRWFCSAWDASLQPFRVGDFARAPYGSLDFLVSEGWLVETAPAEDAICRACEEGHREVVERLEGPRGVRFTLTCPREGRVRVDPEELRQWVVHGEVVVKSLAERLGAEGRIVSILSGALWGLGRRKWQGKFTPAYLAVGLTRSESANMREAVRSQCDRGIVFTLSEVVPTVETWVSILEELGRTSKAEAPTDSWESVTCLVEDFALVWQKPSGSTRISFIEAGFENRKRKGFPNAEWELLKYLAKCWGELESPQPGEWKSDSIRRGISAIRKRLKQLAGRDDDPFHPTLRGGAYQTRFTIRWVDTATSSPPSQN